MSLIYGENNSGHLLLGYPQNVNDVKVKNFAVAGTGVTEADERGVLPGDLLVYTDDYGKFKVVASASDTVAGIAIATNVKLDTVFPQSSDEVAWKVGECGGMAIYGEIAVKLDGTAPKPGAKVYYDLTKKAFSTATTGVEVKNAVFLGKTDGTITLVRINF